MQSNERHSERRGENRIKVDIPIKISIGTQLTVQGKIKDLTLNSAFILMGHNVYLSSNDIVGFSFEQTIKSEILTVEGRAYVTRIVKGEGFALSFQRLEETSIANLKKIIY